MSTTSTLRGIGRHLVSPALGTLFTAIATIAAPIEPGLAQVNAFNNQQFEPTRTLIMGTSGDYIPFEYRRGTEPGGTLIGFDIDIAKYIAQKLGFTLQIQKYRFDALLPALQTEELDFAMAALTPTGPRWLDYDFSIAYFETRHTLVSQTQQPSIQTLADLDGARVAVQKGSVQEQALRNRVAREYLTVQILPFDHVSDMIAAVEAATVDVAIIEEFVAEAYLEDLPTLVAHTLTAIPPTTMAIAFPRGSDYVEQFNQVLRDMEASGELQRLARQWFVAEP